MSFGKSPVMLCLPYSVLQVCLLVLAFATLHSLLGGWKERESGFPAWLSRQYYPALLALFVIWRTKQVTSTFLASQSRGQLDLPFPSSWDLKCAPFTLSDVTTNPRYHSEGCEHPSLKQRLVWLNCSSCCCFRCQASWNHVMGVFIR